MGLKTATSRTNLFKQRIIRAKASNWVSHEPNSHKTHTNHSDKHLGWEHFNKPWAPRIHDHEKWRQKYNASLNLDACLIRNLSRNLIKHKWNGQQGINESKWSGSSHQQVRLVDEVGPPRRRRDDTRILLLKVQHLFLILMPVQALFRMSTQVDLWWRRLLKYIQGRVAHDSRSSKSKLGNKSHLTSSTHSTVVNRSPLCYFKTKSTRTIKQKVLSLSAPRLIHNETVRW